MECDELVNSNPKIYHMWPLFSKEIYQDKIKDFIIDLSEDKDRKKKSKSKRVNKLFVLSTSRRMILSTTSTTNSSLQAIMCPTCR